MTNRALGILADGMEHAAQTLRDLCDAKNDNVRLGASRAVLELGVEIGDMEELRERLAAMEARQQTGTLPSRN
jgi:hypothetical protein